MTITMTTHTATMSTTTDTLGDSYSTSATPATSVIATRTTTSGRVGTTTTSTADTMTHLTHTVPASGYEAGSVFEDQPPAAVYQTLISEGKQDSSSLLVMRVRLSVHAARALQAALHTGALTHDLVYGAIRNFDGTDVRMYDAESNTMQYLQLPQDLFRYDLMSGSLRISVHRKYLPVSKCHGNAPFVFAFFIKPANEVLVTTPFTVLSKEPKVPDAPKAPVKRVRRPPPKPFAAAHTDEGLTISNFLSKGIAAPIPVRAAPPAPHAPASAVAHDIRTPSPVTAPLPVGPTAGIVVPTDLGSSRRKRTRHEAMQIARPDSPGSALDALFDMDGVSGGGGGGAAAAADAGFGGDDELYMTGFVGGDEFGGGTPPLTEDQFQLFLGLADEL